MTTPPRDGETRDDRAEDDDEVLTHPLRVWPEPWQEDMVRAATGDDAAAVAAWDRLRAARELPDILSDASRLAPMVARRVVRAAPDHADTATLRRLHRGTWAANARVLAAALPVVDRLVAAGHEPLVLKGAALVGGYYDDIGARAMVDVDVLVPDVRFDLAYRYLTDAGLCSGDRLEVVRRMGHGAGFSDGVAAVDLHHVMSSWLVLDESRLWGGAETFELLGHRIDIPAPADLYAHLVVHGLRPGRPVNLRWIVDALVVLSERGDDIDWEDLAGCLEGPAIALVDDGTRYLATTFSAPVPATALDALAARRAAMTPLDRLKHRISVTADLGPLAGRMPGLASHWTRTRRGQGTLAAFADLPVFLSELWDVEGPRELPGHLGLKFQRHVDRLRSRSRGAS